MLEIEAVLHVAYGGFSINEEMAIWLVENRGWVMRPISEYDYKKKDEYPLNMLFEEKYYIMAVKSDTMEFRSNRDLIDCVRAIQKLHENDEYPESYYGHIHKLRVKKVKVHIDIEDYHDGQERFNCYIDQDCYYDDNECD